MIERLGACRRHRAALLDFVDHGQIGPTTSEALAHLEGCDPCTEMLDSTVLTIAALRRLGREAARVEPPADSWPRLRARLGTLRQSRISIVSPLGGMVMTVALAALLVAPLPLSRGHTEGADSTESAGPNGSAQNAIYTSAARRGTERSGSNDAWAAPAGLQPRLMYPDGGRPADKEVPSTHSIVRPARLR